MTVEQGLPYFALYVIVLVAALRKNGGRGMYRGRVLTRPIRRRVRVFRMPPEASSGLRGDHRGRCLRDVQFWTTFLVQVFLLPDVMSGLKADTIGWLLIIGYYADDYLTGDDDRWHRFWDSVRNKVKWKMELPQPVPVRETA